MFLIGLTGGIASGKSTVCNIFKNEYHVPIIDADQIARQVVEPEKKGWHRVLKDFGSEILNEDKTINRNKLADIIFKDVHKRRQLNKALHGLIALEIFKQVLYYFVKGYRFIILDVPLLFESKFFLGLLSYKVVVYCDNEEEQIKRLLKRNPELTENDAKLRIQSQINTQEKIKLADFLINNSKDLNDTKNQIKNLYDIFNKSKKYIWTRFLIASAFGIILASFIKFII